MNYKRALITGGAGLIGSHIADRLILEGYARDCHPRQLHATGGSATWKSAMRSGKLTLVEGDVRDAEVVRYVTEGRRPSFSTKRRSGSRNARRIRG